MDALDERMKEVFDEVFDSNGLAPLTDTTSSKDIPKWDSLAHVKLIMAMEQQFGVKFTIHEVTSMATVGDFKKALVAKRSTS